MRGEEISRNGAICVPGMMSVHSTTKSAKKKGKLNFSLRSWSRGGPALQNVGGGVGDYMSKRQQTSISILGEFLHCLLDADES